MSDFAHHYREKARRSLAAGDPVRALRYLERALRFSRTPGEHEEILLDLAETAVQMEDLEAAEAYLNRSPNRQHPRHALLLGMVELQRFQVNEALTHLKQAVTLAPRHPEARLHLAAALTLTGRPQKALDLLKTLAREHPDDLRILREMALAHAREGNLMQAYHLARQVARRRPEDPHIQDFLAMLREVLVEGPDLAPDLLNPPPEYLRVFYLVERYFEQYEAPAEALEEAIDLWAQYSSYEAPRVRRPELWAAAVIVLALERIGPALPAARVARRLGLVPGGTLYRRIREIRLWFAEEELP